jgi:cytochrome c biogenesis protein CcdA
VIELIIVSFIAGVFTVAAPCILPLLPVIVGGSVLNGSESKSLKHPIIIVLSLTLSVITFTLLLKASTILLGVPVTVWSVISGGIVLFFGLSFLFPQLWERAMLASGLQLKTNTWLGRSQQAKGVKRDVLLGAALGPVFNSCSPTYALIVAAVLPVSFATGLTYLIAYALGIAAILLLISIFGRSLTAKLGWLANPESSFKKVIGILFIIVGLSVIFGLDKSIQTFVLENGWYDPVKALEEFFLRGR